MSMIEKPELRAPSEQISQVQNPEITNDLKSLTCPFIFSSYKVPKTFNVIFVDLRRSKTIKINFEKLAQTLL